MKDNSSTHIFLWVRINFFVWCYDMFPQTASGNDLEYGNFFGVSTRMVQKYRRTMLENQQFQWKNRARKSKTISFICFENLPLFIVETKNWCSYLVWRTLIVINVNLKYAINPTPHIHVWSIKPQTFRKTKVRPVLSCLMDP